MSLNYSASASSSGEASSRDHAGRQQHAFAGEAGDAGRGSRIGADLTEGRGDGRPRHRGWTDGDGRRPDATDATLSSHMVLPDIPHGDNDRPRDRDDRDHGSHGDREEPRAAAPGPALFEADKSVISHSSLPAASRTGHR